MTYDKMKATVTVEVAKNGHTLTTVTNVTSTGGVDANGNATDGTADKNSTTKSLLQKLLNSNQKNLSFLKKNMTSLVTS